MEMIFRSCTFFELFYLQDNYPLKNMTKLCSFRISGANILRTFQLSQKSLRYNDLV